MASVSFDHIGLRLVLQVQAMVAATRAFSRALHGPQVSQLEISIEGQLFILAVCPR